MLLVLSIILFHSICGTFGASIKASPDSIDRIGDITVTWEGIDHPTSEDFVSVHGVDVKTEAVKILAQIKADQSPSWRDGHGSLTFNLLNMRKNYVFYYHNAQELKSNIVSVNPAIPMQIHLALTNQSDEMLVLWVSNATIGTVQYGTNPNNLNLQAQAYSNTYVIDDLCWKTQNGRISLEHFWEPGQIQAVTLSQLEPDTTYYYKVGDGVFFSAIYAFQSQATTFSTVKLIAYGDAGTGECEDMIGDCTLASLHTTSRILSDIQAVKHQAVLHIGDISYARGHAVRWEQFFHQYEPIASTLPYMVCIGNHEYDYIGQPFDPAWGDYAADSGGECGVPFNARFQMPGNGRGNLWYSFEYPGVAHITLMSTEHDFLEGSPQYKWIENDLSSVDRTATPWLIVAGHRPMYTAVKTESTLRVAKFLRESMEPLLRKYSVDVALWGHVHNYERTCNVYDSKCGDDGTVHFVIGSAGARKSEDWAAPKWLEYKSADYGYTRITMDPSSFHLEYVVNFDGKVHDEVTLKK